jgi:N-acyl homoserine lactone hydrolase
MKMGKKLRFAILHNGWIENDLSWNMALPHVGTIEDKSPPQEWVRNPMFSVLIDHPTLGWVLYDTSCAAGDESDRLPKFIRENFPVYIEKEDFVDQRLLSCGVRPEDLSMIVLSHMHFDHVGGLCFFTNVPAGQNIITGRADFAHALVESHYDCDHNSSYIRANFEYPNLKFKLIDGDWELAPDFHLVMFEGHAPSIVGMMLHLESGTYIFPSDAMNIKANYGPPPTPPVAPAQCYDSLGYRRTLAKLEQLQRKYNATIIYPHDGAEYAKLKKAPEFYE